MIDVIDNFDSFVYNLVQYTGALGEQCRAFRNDAVSVPEIMRSAPDLLLISPGPGDPRGAGVSLSAVRELAGVVPIFGVCLGHQTIGEAFGARVVHARQPMHGKCSSVVHDGLGVFQDLPSPITVTRYHSLVVDPATLPPELEVSAWSEDGEVMGLRHRDLAVEGVQFHPESLFTAHGLAMVRNALAMAGATRRNREGLVSA